MKVRSWLSATCTTTVSGDFTAPIPRNHHRHSSTATASSPDSSETSCSSLQSNLSLQTHPSVTSLNHHHHHHLSPEYSNLAVNHRCVSSLRPHPSLPISALSISSGLLFASSGHRIAVYDRTTLSLLHSFAAHNPSSGAVKSLAAVPGGHLLLSAHQDSKIRLWEAKATPFHETHKFLTSLPTASDRLRRFALPKNYVAVRRHHRRLWIEHADAVAGLAVGENLIYSVSWDKTLKIWRKSDLRCLESVKAHDDAVNAVAVSGDGTVFTGSADNRIRVWAKPVNEERHALVATLEKHKSAVNALTLSDDGSVLYSGSCDRSVLVWEREDSASYMVVAGALRGHGGAVLGLCHVSGFLFSGSADRTVRMWRRGREGRYCCLAVLEGHVGAVKSVEAVMEGGDEENGVVSVVSGSLDGEVKVWEVSVSSLDNTLKSD